MGNIKLICAIILLTANFAVNAAQNFVDSDTLSDHFDRAETRKTRDKIQNAGHLYKFQFSENEKQAGATRSAVNSSSSAAHPQKYILHQNFPNPFNARTFLKFEITNEAFFDLDIFDSRGRHIVCLLSARLAKGVYIAPWDATNEDDAEMSSGIYYARLRAENSIKIIRMVLLR